MSTPSDTPPSAVTPDPLPEFDREMAITRRLLARVPDADPDWRPHPKSFSIAHLAQLVADMPRWLDDMLRRPGLDLAAQPGYRNEPTAALLAAFDANVARARGALEHPTDPDAPWRLTYGAQVLSEEPRGVVVRTHLSHMIHHRAQLGVYLRLLDVPVPCVYGPTADESW